METIKVNCVCHKCGKTFEVIKQVATKLDADIEGDKIRKRRKPICPECYRDEQQQRDIDMAEKMGLPELIGSSEKQISYAFSLRNKYIKEHKESITIAQKELDKIDPGRISPVAKNRAMEEEQCLEEAFKRIGLHLEFLCLTEINAHRIIDLLRR